MNLLSYPPPPTNVSQFHEHLICEETLFTCKLLLLIHSVSFWIFLLTVSQSSKTARKCLNTNYLKMLLWNTVNWHNYNGSLDYYIVCFFVMGYGQWNEDFCIMLKHISVCGLDLLIIICLLFREAGWKKNYRKQINILFIKILVWLYPIVHFLIYLTPDMQALSTINAQTICS